MRLATIWQNNVEIAAVLVADKLFPISLINYQWGKDYPVNIFEIIVD